MGEYEKYVKQGLNGEAPLKMILCGYAEGTGASHYPSIEITRDDLL